MSARPHEAANVIGAAVQSGTRAEERSFSRAVRPVPLKIATVSKGNSKGAELLAG